MTTNPEIWQLAAEFPVLPYVRMTQRGRWVNRHALQYRANQEALGDLFVLLAQQAGLDPFEHGARLRISVAIEREGEMVAVGGNAVSLSHKGRRSTGHWRKHDPIATADVDNFAKAVLDALQRAGVFDNDRQVYELHATKALSTRDWISVSISALET